VHKKRKLNLHNVPLLVLFSTELVVIFGVCNTSNLLAEQIMVKRK